MKIVATLIFLLVTLNAHAQEWALGPFKKAEINPILTPNPKSLFLCPIQNKEVHWEGDYTFNPGAIVRNGKVYLLYRAEDDFGTKIGFHTSRIGLAESSDGLHFKRLPKPVMYPDNDNQYCNEWPGGCEDPRIVEREDGCYVMMYTQWNRHTAALAVATSYDLLHWKKHGYAFANYQETFCKRYTKSGSIVCKQEGDKILAVKIRGKYWMYWGEGAIYLASSDDLISWEPVLDYNGELVPILEPRAGKFDSALVEAGPPALLTEEGILLLYNGQNDVDEGDPEINPGAYSAGQVLFDANCPRKVLARMESCFLRPENGIETNGQYYKGTVFIQGLVHFRNQWFLYYGMADANVGVAVQAPL